MANRQSTPSPSSPTTITNNNNNNNKAEETPFASSLRRILLAVSMIREDIQYCQGMNQLAGFLLLVVMDEERAFWILAAILQNLFPKGYFDQTLSGARIDQVSDRFNL